MARETEYGPEFDDRLIKLVRANAAIYDVSHPHYRRTPVRMAIWDNIARELGAPSRFLQTKWKNIRYNYLQEQKCLETGTFNTNIRKRRFTEDLSFLKFTAYRREVNAPSGVSTKSAFNGSDNDSNSFMYPDNLSSAVSSTYEVIELDHSDDEEVNSEYMPDVSAFLAPMNDITEGSPDDPYAQPDNLEDSTSTARIENSMPTTTATTTTAAAAATTSTNGEFKITLNAENQPTQQHHAQSPKRMKSGSNTPDSHRSSPLLTPMSQNGNGATKNGYLKKLTNGCESTFSEITIKPLSVSTPNATLSSYSSTKLEQKHSSTPPDEIMLNAAKRKATPTLQPINDPIELYCLSLVDCLRAMSRSERERVKFEFSKILKDAQYIDQT